MENVFNTGKQGAAPKLLDQYDIPIGTAPISAAAMDAQTLYLCVGCKVVMLDKWTLSPRGDFYVATAAVGGRMPMFERVRLVVHSPHGLWIVTAHSSVVQLWQQDDDHQSSKGIGRRLEQKQKQKNGNNKSEKKSGAGDNEQMLLRLLVDIADDQHNPQARHLCRGGHGGNAIRRRPVQNSIVTNDKKKHEKEDESGIESAGSPGGCADRAIVVYGNGDAAGNGRQDSSSKGGGGVNNCKYDDDVEDDDEDSDEYGGSAAALKRQQLKSAVEICSMLYNDAELWVGTLGGYLMLYKVEQMADLPDGDTAPVGTMMATGLDCFGNVALGSTNSNSNNDDGDGDQILTCQREKKQEENSAVPSEKKYELTNWHDEQLNNEEQEKCHQNFIANDNFELAEQRYPPGVRLTPTRSLSISTAISSPPVLCSELGFSDDPTSPTSTLQTPPSPLLFGAFTTTTNTTTITNNNNNSNNAYYIPTRREAHFEELASELEKEAFAVRTKQQLLDEHEHRKRNGDLQHAGNVVQQQQQQQKLGGPASSYQFNQNKQQKSLFRRRLHQKRMMAITSAGTGTVWDGTSCHATDCGPGKMQLLLDGFPRLSAASAARQHGPPKTAPQNMVTRDPRIHVFKWPEKGDLSQPYTSSSPAPSNDHHPALSAGQTQDSHSRQQYGSLVAGGLSYTEQARHPPPSAALVQIGQEETWQNQTACSAPASDGFYFCDRNIDGNAAGRSDDGTVTRIPIQAMSEAVFGHNPSDRSDHPWPPVVQRPNGSVTVPQSAFDGGVPATTTIATKTQILDTRAQCTTSNGILAPPQAKTDCLKVGPSKNCAAKKQPDLDQNDSQIHCQKEEQLGRKPSKQQTLELVLQMKLKISDRPVKCISLARCNSEDIVVTGSGCYGDEEAVLRWRRDTTSGYGLWINDPVVDPAVTVTPMTGAISTTPSARPTCTPN